jgi:hypothetical protein
MTFSSVTVSENYHKIHKSSYEFQYSHGMDIHFDKTDEQKCDLLQGTNVNFMNSGIKEREFIHNNRGRGQAG